MWKFSNFIKYLKTITIVYQKKLRGLIAIQKSGEYLKFAIISQPRVGSTLLLSYLNYHSQILVKGEVVREKRNNPTFLKVSILEFLEKEVFKKYHRSIKAVGFKYFYEHSLLEPELLRHLITNRSLKLIHLKRKDLLRSYLSHKIAENTTKWSESLFEKKIPLKNRQIQVDVSDFNKYKKAMKDNYLLFSKIFKDHNVLTLYYEDLIENPKHCLSDVQTFLKVKNKKLLTVLERQNPEPIEELIKNHADFT